MLFGEGPQIKNIAADLNKLFRQGSLLNQSVQNVEGDSTADQGTRDLLAARDPVIQEISVGMSGEQSARYTVSGTPPLSLPNSLGKPLKAWEVDVSPYQEGSGDPSPSNVRAIHGTDKIGIYVGSTNIWDEEWEEGTINNSTGENMPSPNDIRCKNYIPILPNTNYCFVLNNTTNGIRYYWYDSDKTFISGYYTPNSNTSTVVMSPSNTAYLKIRPTNSYGTTYNYDIAINYPSTVTTYNPHQGGITSITLPQTVYTGTIGSEGGESRTVEADMGSFNWSYYNSNYFRTDVIADAKAGVNNVVTSAMCEVYKQTAPNDIQEGTINVSTGRRIVVKDSNYSDAASFKASVTGKKIVYELETPTQFAVTTPTIPTPTGTATTWATAEDGTVDSMEVTYVGKA